MCVFNEIRKTVLKFPDGEVENAGPAWLGGKRGAGLSGSRGVENAGSGGKRGVYVENAGSKRKTRGKRFFEKI